MTRVADAATTPDGSSDPALPARWADDPFLLDERTWWRPAEVRTAGDAMLLVQRAVQPTSGGRDDGGPATMLLASGEPRAAAVLVAEHAWRASAAGSPAHRFAWVETAAMPHLTPDDLGRLGLRPARTGWEWMVAGAAPAPVDAERVVRELDPAAEGDAIRACLAAANPTTDADPVGAGERWWGVEDGRGGLGGVIGAGPRAGRPGGRGSAHLHGLGVLPAERGRGLGAGLTAAATRGLLRDGLDWVSLGMWDDNDGARRIYHRLGFATVHRLTTLRRP